MKLIAALSVLLLAVCCSCAVVEVTLENVEGVVGSSDDVLLFFVAGQTEHNRAVRDMAQKIEAYARSVSPGFVIGVIDVHEQGVLERRFLPKVGEIFFIANGKLHSKKMATVSQPHLVEEWIEAHHARSLKEISTKEEFNHFVDNVDNKHATVVIFGGSREDSFHDRLLELSHAFHDTFFFRVVFDQDLIAHALPKAEDREKNVWIFRHFEKESGDIGTTYQDGDDFEALVRWLLQESSPLVHEFGRDEVSTIAAYYKEHLVIMHMEENDAETLEMLYHVAAEKDRYKQIGFFWETPDELHKQLEAMGFDELKGHVPFPICITKDQREHGRRHERSASAPIMWDPSIALTRSSFSDWVDDIISGKLDESATKQKATDVKQEPGKPTKLVRSTFDEAITKPGNLLVLITAPIKVCGGECTLLESFMEKSMKEHELADSITFATIDGMRNYVSDIASRIPSLVLYKDGEKHTYNKKQIDERNVARWIDSVVRPRHRAHDEF